jgi:hypothetical protein
MSLAFTDACSRLGLVHKSDGATQLVAKKIIEAAERGQRDHTDVALRRVQRVAGARVVAGLITADSDRARRIAMAWPSSADHSAPRNQPTQ